MPGSVQERYKNPYTTGSFGLDKGSVCGRNQGQTMLPNLNKSTPLSPENKMRYYGKISQPNNALSPAMQLRYAKKSVCDNAYPYTKITTTGNRAQRLPNVSTSKAGRALTRGTNENNYMYQKNANVKTDASIDIINSTLETRINTNEDEPQSILNYITVPPGQ